MPQPENKFKTYNVNGRKMIFNADLFGDLFTLTARKNDVRFGKYEILLGEKLNVSKDTVHGWRFRKFAPGDIELVKLLAAELGTDFEKLLKEKKEMSADIQKFNDVTRMKVAEVYKTLLSYFEDCREEFEDGETLSLLCYAVNLLNNYYSSDDKDEEEKKAQYKDCLIDLCGCINLHSAKAHAIKRELKLNMLELPDFIYEKWMAQVEELDNTVNNTINEVYDMTPATEDKGPFFDSFPDSVFDNILPCYNEFIQFCKEEILPRM